MVLFHSALRSTIRLGLELYFLHIQVMGRAAIPETGPLLLVANHPNSLMDTLLLSAQTPRRIHFLARAGLFKGRIAGWLLRKLGAIPVHRKEDNPAGASAAESRIDNEGALREAVQLLVDGGCVGIFPEGRNSEVGRVGEFRTGAARLALQAEAASGFGLGLKIVPVGIHFERREYSLSGVLLRVGEPVEAAAWKTDWERDPTAAVRALTVRLQEAVRLEALHTLDDRRADLAQAICDIIGERLISGLLERLNLPRKTLRQRFVDELRNTPYSRRDLDSAFQVKQYVSDVLDHLSERDPDALDALGVRVDIYRDHIEQVRLKHDQLLDQDLKKVSALREAVKATAYAIAFAPVAFFGLVHHVVPWALIRLVLARIPHQAARAITLFMASLLVYPSYYAALGWWLRAEAGWSHLGIALYLGVLPAAGFFWLRYVRRVVRFRQRILARTLLQGRQSLVMRLARERRLLLYQFQQYADRSGAQLAGAAAAIQE